MLRFAGLHAREVRVDRGEIALAPLLALASASRGNLGARGVVAWSPRELRFELVVRRLVAELLPPLVQQVLLVNVVAPRERIVRITVSQSTATRHA